MPLPPMSKRDADQVLRYAFDDATGRIRVDAVAVIGPGGISAADGDNIAISDGVDTLEVNPDGSINTAISGQVQIEIDAADGDNIAIASQDGSNFLDVNPDGSINITDNGGSLTVDQGTNPWTVDGTVTTIPSGIQDVDIVSSITLNVLGPLTDAELRATPVPISGTVTANAGTGTFQTNVTNGAGAAAVNIQDGGNSITVDGAVTVSATDLDIRDLDATQDNVAISDGTDTLAVNADGSINVVGSITVPGTVSVTQGTTPWVVGDGGGSLTVDNNGTFAVQAAQSGAWSVNVNNAAGAAAVNIQDGGNSITVDGTVAATQSGTWTVQPGNTANTTAWLVRESGFSAMSATRPGVNNTSSTVLASNTARRYVMIYNQSGATIYIFLGAGTAVVNEGIRLVNNASYEITSDNLFTGAIQAVKTGAATVNLDIFEGS